LKSERIVIGTPNPFELVAVLRLVGTALMPVHDCFFPTTPVPIPETGAAELALLEAAGEGEGAGLGTVSDSDTAPAATSASSFLPERLPPRPIGFVRPRLAGHGARTSASVISAGGLLGMAGPVS
jgi:hypothetical protein